jgi:hypothetical protein
MNSRDTAQRFRSGRYDDEDILCVVEALSKNDTEFLQQNVFQYIKYSQEIDISALLNNLSVARDPYVASQIISGLSYRECKRVEYVENVLSFAAGKSWDEQNVAQLAALLALPRVTQCTAPVKSILRAAAHHSANPVVRDTALTSAQSYFGIPREEILWGDGSGDMMARMPKALSDWLGADVH